MKEDDERRENDENCVAPQRPTKEVETRRAALGNGRRDETALPTVLKSSWLSIGARRAGAK
jgi:hypothetical protein